MIRIVFCFVLVTILSLSEAFAAPVESVWGGIWHKTRADGSEVDCIDTGPNSDTTDLSGMIFTMTGANGYSYTFDTVADKEVYGGYAELYKELPALPPGVYTFTLDDGRGHVSKVKEVHVAATPLPRVDPGTITVNHTADDAFRFSWAPVNDTRTYYYRLVVFDTQGTPLYYSRREMTNVAEVPPGTLQAGVAYKARVEVHDARSFELLTNRSDSAFRDFTAPAFDARREGAEYAVVYNRFDDKGTLSTDISLGLYNLQGLSAASVTGPGGFSYTFNLAADRDPTWPELYKNVTAPMTPGLYTFRFVANDVEQYAYATLTTAVRYPAPDPATYQAEVLETGEIRFSWGDVDHTGALYYRVYLKDPATEQYTVSGRQNSTHVELPPGYFSHLSNPQWRVEVFDSSSITTQRNRVVGESRAVAPRPFDPERPAIYAGVRHATNFDGSDATSIWMEAQSATQMRLDGPNGYSRDLFTQGRFVDFLEPVTPAPGLYSFSATGSTGKSSVLYNYQPLPHTIPPVDYRTVHVNQENGFVTLNWAPVVSDVPLWYGVEFYYANDQNGDGQTDMVPLQVDFFFPGTSLWLNEWELPNVPFMFRIFALDGSSSSTYNNYSRSVMIGYGAPGFDYAALTDADNDGFASNVDSDDHDPAVNPFPYPVVTAFTLPSGAISLTVPVTVAASGQVGAWCLTESSSSATCSWRGEAPAEYTFSSGGTKTLYAFVRSPSGNISAARSAQTTVGLPPATLTLTFTGSGSGEVSGGMSCSTGGVCPPKSFTPWAVLQLFATAGADSIFTGWSGECAAAGRTCTVTMNGARSVIASFETMPPVWIGPGKEAADFFATVTAAYQGAASGATIRTKAATFTENLTLARPVEVILKGGYGPDFANNAGKRSVLRGTVKIRSGKVVAEGFALR